MRVTPPSWHPASASPKWVRRRLLSPLKFVRFRRALRSLDCVVLDVETGGLDPKKNALLAIGAVQVSKGSIGRTMERWIRPAIGTVVEDEAVRVNGYVPRADHALESEALNELSALIDSHPSNRRPIEVMGHNVWFDLRFIDEAAGRQRDTVPIPSFSHRRYDSCIGAGHAQLLGHVEGRQLDGMCRDLGLFEVLERRTFAHRSPLNDCMASLAVFIELLWRAA